MSTLNPNPEPVDDDEESRTKWLSARVDPELNARAAERADDLGMSKSQYIVALIETDLESAE
jgi:predicted HicB family RNase H-like nuclease